jgi:Phosphotransferase enzyme family
MTPTTDARPAKLDAEGVLAALGLETGSGESGVPYTMIRGNNGPRWLLPNRSRLANTILAEWHPYGLATHFLWRGLRTAARMGALPLAPGTAQLRLPRDAGKRLLRGFGVEGDAADPVILVGNTEATRKLLVFQEIPGRGNVVIKMPLKPMARASIGNEAEVLKRLKGRLGAPRLLGYQVDTGAALQEYLPGRLGSRRCKPVYVGMLIDLARQGETITLRGRAHALRAEMPAHARYAESAAAIEAALRWMEEDTLLPAALVHGDFAPWNIRERQDGGCALIDWEGAAWAGLPMHDLSHFFYMQARLFSPHTLFLDALRRDGGWRHYFNELKIPEPLLMPLAAAFLVETLKRGWESEPAESIAFCRMQLSLLLREAGGPAV